MQKKTFILFLLSYPSPVVLKELTPHGTNYDSVLTFLCLSSSAPPMDFYVYIKI